MPESKFNAERALAPLKRFQRKTVDYVFERMFGSIDPTHQFLVADEVGLGKTMVARGVIAKTIEHLWETTSRIDILYICSNQAIAAQNINRLNVLKQDGEELQGRVTRASRMNLIPLDVAGTDGLDANKVNFISLTPATTFETGTSTGVKRERAFLFHLLKGIAPPGTGLRNLLQATAGFHRWETAISKIDLAEVDEKLIEKFRQDVQSDQPILDELGEVCRLFGYWRECYPQEMRTRRNRLVGLLRAKLSRVCVDALQPDLIILDEFQRFTELLYAPDGVEKISEAAELARELFNYSEGSGRAARTLLLSATPYKMLTLKLDTDNAGVHYKEFLKTISFLFGSAQGPAVSAQLEAEMLSFRRFLQDLPTMRASATASRERIEGTLRKVISRTERVDSTSDRNSMMCEISMSVSLEAIDLQQAISMSAIAKALDAPNIVEYWKSSPYLLNFMRDYKLKISLKEQLRKPSAALRDALTAAIPKMLSERVIQDYGAIDPANGRMRALMRDIFDEELEQLLWIPASLPYYGEPRAKASITKSLIFSAWTMAPDAISALLSYEAERRLRSAGGRGGERLLQFQKDNGRLSGLRTLLLVYPSARLAEIGDPLKIFLADTDNITLAKMRSAIAKKLTDAISPIGDIGGADTSAHTPEWLAPAAIDRLLNAKSNEWLEDEDGFGAVGDEEAFAEHVKKLDEGSRNIGRLTIGPELLELLVDVALGSPAVCALRALKRIAPELQWDDPVLLGSAATVAFGFRTLFNQQDSIALLRQGDDDRYWHRVLTYCASNNLQAVLDEFAHYLVEAEGLVTHEPAKRVAGLAGAMVTALSIRPSQIEVDEIRPDGDGFKIHKFQMRGRLAMRLGALSDEEDGAKRLSSVREAFNSPFKPFVLATTSVGQEGLDFHPYCHRIYHWNLPGNPVDLEQREGRIHRYKNHAVRLNLVAQQAAALRGNGKAIYDIWAEMFEMAKTEATIVNDLVPYWILDGDVKVERRIPMFPMSRETALFEWLKRSLTVYRLAFGQPRQDDLLAYLNALPDGDVSSASLDDLQIRLAPMGGEAARFLS